MAHSNPTTILIGLMRSLRMTLGRGTDGFIGVRSRVMQFYPFFNSLATKAPNRWRRLKLKGVIRATTPESIGPGSAPQNQVSPRPVQLPTFAFSLVRPA